MTVLREWQLAALTGLPALFERRVSVSELKASHERELAELYPEIGRLSTHVNFLKKVALLSHPERRALVERQADALALRTQAELLSLSRSSLY